MTAIEFEVDIECRECGKTLDATVVRSRHSVVTVSVEPCSECISDANNDGIERDKKMSDCNHDPRFHLMGAVNGCCACQLERLSQERDAALEQVTAINETLEMVRKGWDAEIIESWKWRKRCDELEQQLAESRAAAQWLYETTNNYRQFDAEDRWPSLFPKRVVESAEAGGEREN
jgi:hypothetical protein